MARSTKPPRPLTTLRHTARVEVRRAEFELLASVPHLDVAKLARVARGEIEVGYFRTDCCRQFVRAIVQKGMVTELVVEPCSDDKPEPASPELVASLEDRRPACHPAW